MAIEELQQLKRMALAATPGPWKCTQKGRVQAPETEDRLGLDLRVYGNGNKEDNRRNALYIAAANPATILALIDQVEQATPQQVAGTDQLEQASAPAVTDDLVEFEKWILIFDPRANLERRWLATTGEEYRSLDTKMKWKYFKSIFHHLQEYARKAGAGVAVRVPPVEEPYVKIDYNEQLSACPMCGSHDVSFCGAASPNEYTWAKCEDCGTQSQKWDRFDKTVAMWNRRTAAPPAVAQEVVAWDTRYKDGTRWLLSRRKVELAELVREAGDSAKDAISRPLVYGDVPTPPAAPAVVPFQARVQPWMMECFGEAISSDITERNHRFFEESVELVQSTGCTRSEAHQLVDYVFDRPVGEPNQEVGGVMVTLAALCLAAKLDMHEAGETELARINVPETVLKIRAKQAAKPQHSPLPQHVAAPTAAHGGEHE